MTNLEIKTLTEFSKDVSIIFKDGFNIGNIIEIDGNYAFYYDFKTEEEKEIYLPDYVSSNFEIIDKDI